MNKKCARVSTDDFARGHRQGLVGNWTKVREPLHGATVIDEFVVPWNTAGTGHDTLGLVSSPSKSECVYGRLWWYLVLSPGKGHLTKDMVESTNNCIQGSSKL